jgi:hypothetical protein
MRWRNGVWALVAIAPLRVIAAQPEERASPFLVGAASAGLLGFTSGSTPHALVGGYAYAAYPRLILGAQGGATPGGGTADAIYGIATLGYPARAIRESLVYPFIGVGGGLLHDGLNRRARSAIFGAGVGADRVLDEDATGVLLGFRAGYLFRQGDVGERAIYVSIAVGVGGGRRERERPPVIVAQRVK